MREHQDRVRRGEFKLPSGRLLTVLIPCALGREDAAAVVKALVELSVDLTAEHGLGIEPAPPPTNVRPIRNPVVYPIPPSAPHAACRSCHAAVVWITTPQGKKMPVNPDGISHFSTCPQSTAWRK